MAQILAAKGLDAGEKVLAKSVGARLIHVLGIQQHVSSLAQAIDSGALHQIAFIGAFSRTRTRCASTDATGAESVGAYVRFPTLYLERTNPANLLNISVSRTEVRLTCRRECAVPGDADLRRFRALRHKRTYSSLPDSGDVG